MKTNVAAHLKFSYKIGEKAYVLDVAADIKIDPQDLNAEFTRQPGLRAYYAMRYREVERRLEMMEDEFEAWLSSEKNKVRVQLAGGPKPSEGAILDVIREQPEWVERRKVISGVRFVMNTLKDFNTGFEDKSRMLYAWAWTIREVERENREPRVVDRSRIFAHE